MLDPQIFDDIAKRLLDTVPDNVKAIQNDLQANFRSVLQTAFTKLDLVSREEFDTQVKVLARTREKLEQLQVQIKHLEEQQTK